MNEEKRKEREEEFKNKASIVHKGKYGYDNVYFVNKTTKVVSENLKNVEQLKEQNPFDFSGFTKHV